MRNQRRRREFLTFATLCGSGYDILKMHRYKSLMLTGPFRFFRIIDDKMEAAFPIEEKRNEEYRHIQELAKLVTPRLFWGKHHGWEDTTRLLYTSELLQTLLNNGYRLPLDPFECSFLQTVFDLRTTLADITPATGHAEMLGNIPELMRRKGLYL